MHSDILTIGKASDNDLVLAQPHISRHHCRLVRKLDGLIIEDLNSTFGTYVNGSKVTRARVTISSIVVLAGRDRLDWNNSTIVSWLQNSSVKEEQYQDNPQSGISVFDLNSYGVDTITIGRSPSCDIVLANPRISRNHAKAQKNPDGTWTLENLSPNGTHLDGSRITKRVLSPRSQVVLAGKPIVLISTASGEMPVYIDSDEELHHGGEALVEVEDLSFTVPDGQGRKTILSDISLCIQPGEFVGLIGPSGSGKTTLMLMLNGYNKPSSGHIAINNINLHKQLDTFKGFIGYVPQDDIMHRELTVEGSLLYNAKLRLPDLDDGEQRRQVLKVINELGLEKTRNVLIGSPEKKGISGGQRKRVNLAQELITEPSFLLLDEPCSGLDPKSEHDVMKLLKKLSRNGKTIMLTTHGIIQRNFKLLDKLIVLGEGGRLTYFGPAREATKFFGVSEPEDIFDALQDKGSSFWNNKYKNSQFFKPTGDASYYSESSELSVPKPKSHNKFKQLMVLCMRYTDIKWRDKLLSAILLAQAPIIGLLLLLTGEYSDKGGVNIWSFLLVVSSIWLGVSNAAREIVSERAIYKRESMVFLSPGNYLLSKFIILGIIEIIQCFLMLLICYNACSFMGSFIDIYFILLFISISATGLGLLISSFSSSEAQAMALVPMFLIPQVILSGAIVQINHLILKIPAMTMLGRWGWEAVMLVESKTMGSLESNQFVTQFSLNSGNMPVDLIVIGGWLVVYIGMTVHRLREINK